MGERRWCWTLPMYLVLAVTVVVALHTAWQPPLEPPAHLDLDTEPRARREALSTLIDLPHFSFKLPNSCNSSKPLWVGMVSSAPQNFYNREKIRTTWGNSQQVVFLLGLANSTLQPLIEQEAREYGDIVQGSFIDSYRNLTYKHVMGLLWATKNCPGARYLLKLDDDVFVNTPYLNSYLPSLPEQRLIFCPVVAGSLVKRSYRSKWRVTPEEYSARWYPPYCTGWVIVYSPDVASALYTQAQKESYFWIDDVHITGTIAKKLNITHTALGDLGLSEKSTEEYLVGEPRSDFLFSLTKPEQFQKLWTMVSETSSNDL